MRRQTSRLTFGLLVMCWALAGGVTAGADGTGGDAEPYLRAGLGARAAGMGCAQTAAGNDAALTYWNPAALVRLDGIGAASQLSLLGEGRSWGFVSVGLSGRARQGGRFALGASWINFSAGNDIEFRTNNRPEPDGMFGDAGNALFLSAASDFGASVTLGVNVKMLFHALNDADATGVGTDVALWQPLGSVSWGLVLQDAYSALTWTNQTDRLPTRTRAGVEWQALPETLILAADGSLEWSHVAQGVTEIGYYLGAEYQPWPFLALRAGLDRGRYAVGAGVRLGFGAIGLARIDYALTQEQLPGAGAAHLFSLVLNFPRNRPSAEASAL